jgi:hypothetical protein
VTATSIDDDKIAKEDKNQEQTGNPQLTKETDQSEYLRGSEGGRERGKRERELA